MFDGFPCSLVTAPSLPCSPLMDEDPSYSIGLSALHGLFSLLDLKFVSWWNGVNQMQPHENSFADLSLLQEHLRSMQLMPGLSDVQRADVLVTQQWLRLVFWQLALRQGFVSSNAGNPAFSYNFPVEIALTLRDVVKSLPAFAIEVSDLHPLS